MTTKTLLSDFRGVLPVHVLQTPQQENLCRTIEQEQKRARRKNQRFCAFALYAVVKRYLETNGINPTLSY